MTVRIAFAALVLAACACTDSAAPGPVPGRGDAASDLARLAVSARRLEYRAAYRYEISGPLAPSAETRMEVFQKPPDVMRRVRTTTPERAGRTRTTMTWLLSSGNSHTSCFSLDFPAQQATCVQSGPPAGFFGLHGVDEVLELTQDPESFRSVRDAPDETIAGLQGRCFVADSRRQETGGTPKPQSPAGRAGADPSPQSRFEPSRYRFDLCYSSEGIPLRIRRTLVSPLPTNLGRGERVSLLLEATSVSRNVRDSFLEPPAPPTRPEDLRRSPAASPA